jgi:hypothetical protein
MTEEVKNPGAEVKRESLNASEKNLEQRLRNSEEAGKEVPAMVSNLVRETDKSVKTEIEVSRKRLEEAGSTPDVLIQADQAGDRLQEYVKREKANLLSEVVNAAPDVLRHRVNEAASFLLSKDSPSPQALEEEFTLDPETAQAYYDLAQSFGEVGGTLESKAKPDVRSEDESQDKAAAGSGVESSQEKREEDSGQIRVGSMVRIKGERELRKVTKVTTPELKGGSSYVYVEGVDKGIIASDFEPVLLEETAEKSADGKVETERGEPAGKEEVEQKPKPKSPEAPAFVSKREAEENFKKAVADEKIAQVEQEKAKLKRNKGKLEEAKEKVERKIEEARIKTEEVPVKPETAKPAEKIEKPPKELIRSFAPSTRTIFERLGTRAKNFLVRNIWNPPRFVLEAFGKSLAHKVISGAEKVERLRFTGYRIGALFNSVMTRRAESGLIRSNKSLSHLAVQKEAGQRRVDVLRSHLARRDEQIKRDEVKYSLSESEKVQLEIEKNRIEEEIRKAEVSQQDIERRFNTANEKAEYWRRRQEELVGALVDKIDRRMEDRSKRLETIEKRKTELDQETQQIRRNIDEWQKELKEFGPDLPKFIRHKLNDYIEQAQDALYDVNQERARIESDLIRLDERMRPWDTVKGKFKALLRPEKEKVERVATERKRNLIPSETAGMDRSVLQREFKDADVGDKDIIARNILLSLAKGNISKENKDSLKWMRGTKEGQLFFNVDEDFVSKVEGKAGVKIPRDVLNKEYPLR